MSNFENKAMATVVEDIEPNNLTKGINGEYFKIKLTPPSFDSLELITYDIFEGVELYIKDKVAELDNFAIYEVQLVHNETKYFLDNKYLQTGVNYFRVSAPKAKLAI